MREIKAAWEQVEAWLAEHHCPTQMSAALAAELDER